MKNGSCFTLFSIGFAEKFFNRATLGCQGIDPVIWEQAKRDNPDPKNLIPVPMIGFTELRNRLQHQELMAKQHQSRLDVSEKATPKRFL